jgi:ankyrin repeat protein
MVLTLHNLVLLKKRQPIKNSAIVKLLLEAGADANAGLLPAVKINDTSITQMLVTAGATVSSSELIITAAPYNNPTLTDLLLDAGANPADALSTSLKKMRIKCWPRSSKEELMQRMMPI